MLKQIDIPYHTGTMPLHVDEDNLKAVIVPAEPEKRHADSCGSPERERELVLEALRNPIDSPRLRDLAAALQGNPKILIITSDHTRSVPSKLTLPLLLEEIRSGAPHANIAIIIATGLHRATTTEEQRAMFGDEIIANETIYVHDARNVRRYQKQLGRL